MGKADYAWIPIGVILLLIVVFWRPISGFFTGMSDSATNKEQYEAGKLVFYDNERWLGEGSYASCAMCHAADWKQEAGRKVDMRDYVEGQPVILARLGEKYSAGMLGTSDVLYERTMRCLGNPDRINGGKPTMNAPFMQDLMEYLRKQ